MKSTLRRVVLPICVVLFLSLLTVVPCRAAEKESATQQATESVNGSAQAVAEGFTNLQTRISEHHLTNRTRDENVAFILMGILVASVTGMFSKIRSSGAGMLGRLILGLGGAFIGGMVVRVAQIDFEWGTVTMGYEELLFSLLCAVALVLLSRLIQFQLKKRKSKP